MKTVSIVVVIGVAGMLVLGSVGCVDPQKYDALMMQNRTLQSQLIDKDVDVARLKERNAALNALMKQREENLANLKEKNEVLQRNFDSLMETYQKVLEGVAIRPEVGGPIPIEAARKIERIAAAYPNLFTFDRAKGELRFNADLTFDSGSNVVKAAAAQALVELAKVLTSDVGSEIASGIVGHTDSVPVRRAKTIDLLKGLGLSADNMGLSIARARSVAAVLQDNGVAKSRITTSGKGAKQPVADNRTDAGRTKNRRVEIFLSVPAGAAAASE